MSGRPLSPGEAVVRMEARFAIARDDELRRFVEVLDASGELSPRDVARVRRLSDRSLRRIVARELGCPARWVAPPPARWARRFLRRPAQAEPSAPAPPAAPARRGRPLHVSAAADRRGPRPATTGPAVRAAERAERERVDYLRGRAEARAASAAERLRLIREGGP